MQNDLMVFFLNLYANPSQSSDAVIRKILFIFLSDDSLLSRSFENVRMCACQLTYFSWF